MSIYKFTTAVFLFSFLLNQSYAVQCPERKNIPACPTSGATLLDETYPTQAFVISNQGYLQTKESSKVTQRFLDKLLRSYEYKNIPQIILPISSRDDFNKYIETTKKQLDKQKLSADQIQAIIGQISYVPLRSYTWQQDWFESFVDLKTGAPVIKQIESYDILGPESSALLSSVGSSCGMQVGSPLVSNYLSKEEQKTMDPRASKKSFGSGEMGGNIEGAPGGFCLLGDNLGEAFAKQVCSGEDNIIQLQTSWLIVGHVDEFLKITPTNFNDGRPKECEFALMAASPKKALELMNTPPMAQGKFLNIDISDDEDDPNEMRKTRTDSTINNSLNLCKYVVSIVKNKQRPVESLPPAVKSVFIKLLMGLSSAEAGHIFVGAGLIDKNTEVEKVCSENIDSITNAEFQTVLKEDKAIYDLNLAIEESIQADRKLIKNKILSRLPQCAKYYSEIEAPNIFYGDEVIKNEATGKFELPKPGTVSSFLPNPTNSVLMNKTLLFPDSGNRTFNQYMVQEMNKIKMKADFLPTWDYAHQGDGNIHCASHSITHCRPH